jgi:hypothetical protein
MTPHGLNTLTSNGLEKFGFVGVGVSVVCGMQEHVDTVSAVKPGCGELLAPTEGRRILEDLRQWIWGSRRIGGLRRPRTFCIGGGDNQHDRARAARSATSMIGIAALAVPSWPSQMGRRRGCGWDVLGDTGKRRRRHRLRGARDGGEPGGRRKSGGASTARQGIRRSRRRGHGRGELGIVGLFSFFRAWDICIGFLCESGVLMPFFLVRGL